MLPRLGVRPDRSVRADSEGSSALPRSGSGGKPGLSGRRPAEIFFSASFSLPKKKLPYPALVFDGQLKTRNAPGTSSEPYPIPVLADPAG